MEFDGMKQLLLELIQQKNWFQLQSVSPEKIRRVEKDKIETG